MLDSKLAYEGVDVEIRRYRRAAATDWTELAKVYPSPGCISEVVTFSPPRATTTSTSADMAIHSAAEA